MTDRVRTDGIRVGQLRIAGERDGRHGQSEECTNARDRDETALSHDNLLVDNEGGR
jgi:hypothetical protein